MRYLFWNTHRNENINPVLCDLIVENNVSFVALAEYDENLIDDLIERLALHGFSMQAYPTMCERICILGTKRFPIKSLGQEEHASLHIINNDIILCCVHLNSQIYSDNAEDREIYIERIIYDILTSEENYRTNNTVIVGDFNMNPYDRSCINARYFHGMPIYEEAKRNSRIVAGKEYNMFYNPMWNFLGDFHKPYGTHYFNSGKAVNTYWNIYDQVMIRPSLRQRFADDSLKILTHAREASLLDKNGHPDKTYSDHLPIMFEIKENHYGYEIESFR